MSGFGQLPRDGTIVSISQGGHFVGKTNQDGKEVQTTEKLGSWQGFAIEHDGGKFSLRQVESGLYLGGKIQENKHPLFVKARNAWQNFTLENRGGTNYAIKSQDNTYLTRHHDKLVWKAQPEQGHEVWHFETLVDAPHDFKQGFSSMGNEGVGYNGGKLHGYLHNWFTNIGKKLNTNTGLPQNGEEVVISRNGHYVGHSHKQGDHVKLSKSNEANERLIVEVLPDGKYGFRQKVSGLFLGGQIHNKKKPQWVPALNDWEKFTLQERQGGQFIIRSHANTLLTQDGDDLIWRENGENNHQLFTFIYPNRNNSQGFNQGFNQQPQVPVVGNIIYIHQGNHYIGGVKDQNTAIKLSGAGDLWEKFHVEGAPDGKVSFKQDVSGLYLGGQIHNNKHPTFVPHAKEWEHFTLEGRGAGTFAIKSHSGTYLESHNGGIVWKDKPEGGKEVWQFNVLNAPQNQNQGFNNNSGFGGGFQGGFQGGFK